MLCCIAELACFVFGIIALVKGEFKLSANRVVRSGPARAIGVLLLTPLVIGTGGEIVFGSARALELMQQGKQVNAQAVNEGAIPTYLLIHLAGGLPLLVALFVALGTAGPARRPAQFDDDDDRPRRRRRREDDEGGEEDEDRPRRRRPEEEDEEDDRPRRRPPRDEDDEHIKEK